MTLVAGVDSSTQSCKVVVRDAESGELVRSGSAPHPDGTSVDPAHWRRALAPRARAGRRHGRRRRHRRRRTAARDGLPRRVRCSRARRAVVERHAVGAGGGRPRRRARRRRPGVGGRHRLRAGRVVHVSKLRWFARAEPDRATRTAAVCLPHDWLTWQLAGAPGLDALCTDRGDASGTGYWSPASDAYRTDLLELAFGATPHLPRVLGPAESAGATASGACSAPGRATTRGGTRCRRRTRRRHRLDRHVRRGECGEHDADCRRVRASWPDSPTPPAFSCRSCAR